MDVVPVNPFKCEKCGIQLEDDDIDTMLCGECIEDE